MKLHGVEGMSPEDIRNEVDRGGKLVIYTYCISILVMTFKRPTDIRLVRAGQNGAVASLPFTLISFVFGWWGFPWGPIYTIETIYRNLSGGIDVTHDVLSAILPPPPLASTVAGAAPIATPAPAPTSFTPAPPKRGINFKTIGLMAAIASFLAALGITIHCYQQQQTLKVALISGLNQPYTVTLNGKPYKLGAHGSRVVELPEGDFVLADAKDGHVVGTPQTLHFEMPFFDHLFEEKLAIINPDATAIIYNQQVPYYKDGTTPPESEPVFTLYANRQSYFIDRPDYVLEPMPERMSMPTGTSVLIKTKLEYARQPDALGGILTTLQDKLGYPAVVEHFQLLARQRTDEPVLRAAMANLKKEDWVAFFRSRLADRPLLIEWHRYYQRATEYAEPKHDLAGEYRNYLKAEPTNGALLYLTGRVIDDRAESHQLWTQALAVDPPCAYASAAFGFDAFSDGNFEQAATYYAACEKAGITSEALDHYRQKTYWALGQFPKILESIRAKRTSAPLNLELAGNEISVLLAASPNSGAATEVKTGYLASARKAHFDDADLKMSKAYLDAIMAYQTNRVPDYLAAIKQLDSAAYRFEAAVTQGDLKAAEAADKETPETTSENLLLLYLVAKQGGDDAGADRLFTAAVDAMRNESREKRQAARLLGISPLPAGELCRLGLDADEKSILLTALGLRDPANRATYHALAAKLDFYPRFPHRFLGGIYKL